MFHICLCYAILSVPCSLVITCWEKACLEFQLHRILQYVLGFDFGVLQKLDKVLCINDVYIKSQSFVYAK